MYLKESSGEFFPDEENGLGNKDIVLQKDVENRTRGTCTKKNTGF